MITPEVVTTESVRHLIAPQLTAVIQACRGTILKSGTGPEYIVRLEGALKQLENAILDDVVLAVLLLRQSGVWLDNLETEVAFAWNAKLSYWAHEHFRIREKLGHRSLVLPSALESLKITGIPGNPPKQ